LIAVSGCASSHGSTVPGSPGMPSRGGSGY
jgi:hypothetical protein